jgi:heavy metal efflux system protein
MIDSLIDFSIRNKLIVFLFIIGLVGWGGWSVTQLPIDALPDITNNQVIVYTRTPALASQEVEKLITAPLERSFANMPKIEEIRSISRIGISVITIVFKDEVDVLEARQMVTEQMQQAQEEINTLFGSPALAPITTGLGEIYQYYIKPQKGYETQYSLSDIRTVQDWIVRRQLAGIPGVIEVSSFGGYLKQYEIALDPERLQANNLGIADVFVAIQKNNANTGGSYIEKNDQALFIRGDGMVKDLSDLEKIVVGTRGNVPLLVKDVAKVRFGHATRYGAMTLNGEGETAGGIVMMLKGENSAATIEGVKTRIEQIQKSLPEGLEIIPFLDRTRLVERAIHTVSKNLIEGGLIVIVVLVILLGNLRAGLIVASAIPLVMLFTLGLMNQFGLSANLMSLGSIDFGLIVDGAVIIVESTVHYIHHQILHNKDTNTTRFSQTKMDEMVGESARRIRKSAAFGEIIILIVYLPILTLSGIEGKMFGPMAQTVSFALLGALILSLTYIPMVSALFLSKQKIVKETFSDRLMAWLYKYYEPMIKWSLNNQRKTVGIAITMLVAAGVAFGRLGGEFIPELDEGDFAVDTRMPTGASLSSEIDLTLKAEKVLLRFPEVKEIVGKIGAGEVPTDPMPMEAADMMVILNENRDEWINGQTMDELADTMQKAVQAALPGGYFDFQQPIQMRFNELMTGVKSDIAVKIYGEDLDILYQKGIACNQLIEKIEGVALSKVESVEGIPQIAVTYRREKMAQYGINIEDVNQLIRTAFAGELAGAVYEGERRFDVAVRLDTTFRKDIENLQNLYVNTMTGGRVPLQEIAEVAIKNAPVQVSRDNTKRRITIGINVRNRDVESVVHDIQKVIESKVKLPSGYYYTYGGAFENLEKAKTRLLIVVPIALLLIFVLLYFTFHSFKEAILIFSAVPLSAIGGVIALLLADMPFSVSAGVGFIALFGVAVLNGIVLIGYFNQLEKDGINDTLQRIMTGLQVRFRPIVMTATVASFGFMPMALSHSAGAEVQKPLAIVVIGGLISATLLTLIVLPVLYKMSNKGA